MRRGDRFGFMRKPKDINMPQNAVDLDHENKNDQQKNEGISDRVQHVEEEQKHDYGNNLDNSNLNLNSLDQSTNKLINNLSVINNKKHSTIQPTISQEQYFASKRLSSSKKQIDKTDSGNKISNDTSDKQIQKVVSNLSKKRNSGHSSLRPGSALSGKQRNSKGFQEFKVETTVEQQTIVTKKSRPMSYAGDRNSSAKKILINGGRSVNSATESDEDDEESAEESDRTFSLDAENKEDGDDGGEGQNDKFNHLNDDDNSDEEAAIRIYDVRFKIPANASVSGVMSGKAGKKRSRAYRRLISNLERFKKLSSSLIVVIMSLACCFTLAAYAYQMYLTWGHQYFIARTIETVTKIIDFETITAKEITYFLYKNTTDGARDADGKNGLTTIVDNIEKTCGANQFATMQNLDRITLIRNNLASPYMRASEVYIMVLILVSAFLCCIWIPFNMNEYSLPIYFRNSYSNVFLDFLNMRIVAFAYFITLTGCFPHFNFYMISLQDKCLHTSSSNFDIEWTDQYQFIMTALVWAVTVPYLSFGAAYLLRDNIRYVMIPVMIATMIWQILITILAAIIIGHSIKNSNFWWIRLMHLYNLGVLFFSVLIASCYRHYFSRRDLLKTDEEEIQTT